jgi:3-dehydroquinate dehydratase-2
VPVVEVHLSNLAEREEWRQHSVVSDVVTCTVTGKGPDGYRDALQYLAVQRA